MFRPGSPPPYLYVSAGYFSSTKRMDLLHHDSSIYLRRRIDCENEQLSKA